LAVVFLRAGLRAVDFFAVFLRVAVAFAVLRFRVAAAFLPAAARLVDFRLAGLRAVDFLAAVFLRAGLRAADFLAAVFLLAVVRFLVAAAFFAAVFLLAVVRFLVAAAFFAAVFRRVVVRFLAAGRFLAAVFRAAIPSPFPSWITKGPGLRRHPFEASPFPFAHPAPDAVPLVTTERVVEALDPNGTLRADAFGLP